MTAFVEPWIRSLGLHVTICPCCVHCGRLVAQARVSCIINSASRWHCVLAAFSAYGQSKCQDKQRSKRNRERNFRKKSDLLHTLPWRERVLP